MKITETCLYAKNLDEAESFYSGIMNFEMIAKDEGRHLFYRCENGMLLIFNPDDTISRQTEVGGSEVPLHGAKGQVHVAFSVEQDQYDDWKDKIEGHGIIIESEIVWSSGIRSFYFRDPSGNSLEIICGNMWSPSGG